LQEKELLLREIHHRVNNSLQLISSLINIQASYIKDEESIEFFKESQNRVKSISMIHEKLYQSKNLQQINFSSYLSSIIINLFQAYIVDQKIKYNIKCNNIKLNMETAIPCGLIITELITNSLKHAFGNEIFVEMYLDNKTFNLIVKDNGIGFPEYLDFRNAESLGLQLVNLLVNQLDGTIKLENKDGTEFRIKFKELKYKRRINSN
jgi:two-component system, sensor histidine kinase PdtaS